MNPPLDAKGKPMVQISNGCEELIPTAQYANVKIGPATVTKWVEDTPLAIETGLAECFVHAQSVLGQKRKQLLDAITQAGLSK